MKQIKNKFIKKSNDGKVLCSSVWKYINYDVTIIILYMKNKEILKELYIVSKKRITVSLKRSYGWIL